MDALQARITGICIPEEDYFANVARKRAFHAGVFVGPALFNLYLGLKEL
jgi:hypothetical protein